MLVFGPIRLDLAIIIKTNENKKKLFKKGILILKSLSLGEIEWKTILLFDLN